MLILIATPIGNLQDISPRALETLASCDAILVEDSRKSAHLLTHYKIKKKLILHHKFNEKKSLAKIIDLLEEGQTLALISDAGTPCINDPGHTLVKRCLEKGIEVRAIPGPCSVIQALVLSGFDTTHFQFLGFLPKKAEKMLRQTAFFPGTSIAFESPERLLKTLKLLPKMREVAIIRETTKKFEEVQRGSAQKLVEHFTKRPPKGEIVIVLGPDAIEEKIDTQEMITLLKQNFGLTLKEAIAMAAKLSSIPKSQIYKEVHSLDEKIKMQ